MQPRILVLGAGGSVGRAVVQAMQAEAGVTVVSGLRRPRNGACADTVFADATNILELVAAFDGMTHVVNAVGGSADTLRRSAVAVCAAARVYPGLRLVHISSMAVYGDATGLVGEDAPLMANAAYGAAKITAEAEVAAHVRNGLSAVILRPGIVCGPGSAQWTARLTRLLHARRLGDLGAAGDGFCNLIDERDLGAACLAACLREEAAGLAFNLAVRNPPTWNEYLVNLARAVGATPVRRITARRLAMEARIAAPVLAVGRRFLGARVPDPIPASLLRLFCQRMRLDFSRADSVLRLARTHEVLGTTALAAE